MYNKRERGPPSKGLIRKGIQGLASGVGLVSEGVKAHKEGKAAARESKSSTTSESSNRQVDNYQPLLLPLQVTPQVQVAKQTLVKNQLRLLANPHKQGMSLI
jgi:hypothetical protein